MNNLALISLRILSVYLVVTGLNSVAGIATILKIMEPDPEFPSLYFSLQLVEVAVPIIIGAFLWLLSAPLSRFVASGASTDQDSLNDRKLVGAGTFLIGVYLVASPIPSLVYVLTQYQGLEYGMGSSSVSEAIQKWSFQIVLGALLMISHRFFVRAYVWLRSAG